MKPIAVTRTKQGRAHYAFRASVTALYGGHHSRAYVCRQLIHDWTDIGDAFSLFFKG